MLDKYIYIIGIIDTLNDWNEKLNNFASEHMDNVWTGVLILGILIVIAVFGINTLNKRQ